MRNRRRLIELGCAFLIGAALTQLMRPESVTTATIDGQEVAGWLKPGAVLSLHRMAAKPDVDRAEVERFLETEYFPAWAEAFPGSRVFMLRGERGENAAEYGFLWVFESLEARNRYFPVPNEPTDEYTELHEAQLRWLYADDKLPRHAAFAGSATDYVIVR
jgi:hypothetical protein